MGICKRECMECSPEMNPQFLWYPIVVGCHCYMKPLKGESLSVAKPTT